MKKPKKFKKLQDKFATIQNRRDDIGDIWVGSTEFWQGCKWFFEQGKKKGKVVTTFPQVYWQPIEDLTIEQGSVLGRCGNEFSLIVKESVTLDSGLQTIIVSIETGEEFDAKEFLVFPVNNRREVEVTYSAKGLVLGVTWEGVEGMLPSLRILSESYKGCLIQAVEGLNSSNEYPSCSLTGTGDFQKELGAILAITKTTTIQVNGKPFVNTEVYFEYVGDLTIEQMELLDSEFII